MIVDNITTAEIFEEAIVQLDKCGWTQFDTRNDAGQVCAIGAVIEAVRKKPKLTQMFVEQGGFIVDFNFDGLLYIETCPGDMFSSLAEWNDTETTTKEDVIDLFTKSAKRLRELG